MRSLVVYSSRTGNTKTIAEAIGKALGEGYAIADAENAPDPEEYDFIALGFGIYHGWPDEAMRSYMSGCHGKDIGIFITLGAYPDSEHAFICMGRAEGLMASCRVRARFICHGRIAPDLVARMKARPAGVPHSWDEECAKRVLAAESHPDAHDLKKAAAIFSKACQRMRMTEK